MILFQWSCSINSCGLILRTDAAAKVLLHITNSSPHTFDTCLWCFPVYWWGCEGILHCSGSACHRQVLYSWVSRTKLSQRSCPVVEASHGEIPGKWITSPGRVFCPKVLRLCSFTRPHSAWEISRLGGFPTLATVLLPFACTLGLFPGLSPVYFMSIQGGLQMVDVSPSFGVAYRYL